jgi:hypothetical protein
MPALAKAAFESYLSEDSRVTEFIIRHPWMSADALRIEEQAGRVDGERQRLNDRDSELFQKIQDSRTHEGRLRDDFLKMGFPVHIDPKTKEKVKTDWQAPFRNERAAWEAERERNTRKNVALPTGRRFEMEKWIKANSDRTYRQVERPTFDGDAFEIIKDKESALRAINYGIQETEDANATDDEVTQRVWREYATRRQRGEAVYFGILRNGSLDHRGKFDPRRGGGFIEFPTTDNMESILDIMFALDKNQTFFHAMNENALAANKGRPQMSVDDKITRLAELAKQKRAAEFDLEAAYRYAESKGATVKQVQLPIPVLLRAELDTTAPAITHIVSQLEPEFG